MYRKLLAGLALMIVSAMIMGCSPSLLSVAPKADAATHPADEVTAPTDDAEATLRAFYDAYLGYQGNPMVDKIYHDSPTISADFATQVDDLIASFDRGAYDPFICAQDRPSELDFTALSDETFQVETDLGHAFTVTMSDATGTWQIDNITCE